MDLEKLTACEKLLDFERETWKLVCDKTDAAAREPRSRRRTSFAVEPIAAALGKLLFRSIVDSKPESVRKVAAAHAGEFSADAAVLPTDQRQPPVVAG